ncbi:hypothetical protein EVJ58_g1621 [Rhodofomes roseus]|uniref:Vacuolar import and degradation protein 21 n=1 Tax=Rhodofomes roseus TaxID=34475 RepID=A0A4Y9Z0C0_9APHY|nr:hypothetical protein EVJ58_g1621 [Rhodofomes roseus]
MSELAEALVEDRLLQLQEISKRRNQLLQEMYQLMQKRENLGSAMVVEPGDGQSLQVFLERFDLQKHPDTGCIASLTDAEIFGDKLSAADDGGPQGDESNPHVQDIAEESTISELPVSPRVLDQPEHATIAGVLMDDGEQWMELSAGTSPPPTGNVNDDRGYGSDSDVKRGTKRKRSSRQSSEESASGPSRSRSRSHFSHNSRPRSLSASTDELCLRPEKLRRSPSPRSVGSPYAQDQTQPMTLFGGEPEEDFKEDVRVDETSSDTVSHLLQASPPESSRPSPAFESKRRLEYITTPPPAAPVVSFNFVSDTGTTSEVPASPAKPRLPPDFVRFKQEYSLPPLSVLPVEFQRKGVSGRHKKKRDKDKHEKGGDKGEPKKDDWQPIGIHKWGALVRANPVWKKLAKATKCVSTHDWNVAYRELRLIRTLERVELLKEGSGWSYRQPKKQRTLGGTAKSHWDYLMDEMRWMRVDYREERRWKIALAYNLAHAVMEWHEAQSLEERVRRGICVLWKRPRPEEQDEDANLRDDVEIPDMDNDRGADSRETNTPANDSDSEDESDDEGDKDRANVYDPLAPDNLARDAVEGSSNPDPGPSSFKVGPADLRPKTEDDDDLSVLRLPESSSQRKVMDIDGDTPSPQKLKGLSLVDPKHEENALQAMKLHSKDPTLVAPYSKSKARRDVSAYGPLRDQILSLEMDKLVLDLDDAELVKGMTELSTDDNAHHNHATHLPPADLSSIFPDLTPYGMLEPVTGIVFDRRKSEKPRVDKDDPNKRIDDTLYSKLTPMSDFMLQKPTLLGALQPSSHWSGDHWETIEEMPVTLDYDSPMSRTIEDSSCSLFEGLKAGSPSSHLSLLPHGSKDSRRRTTDVLWTPQDDALLKQFADMYPNNWALITDAFNSSRVTIATDKRSAADCFDRWNTRWGRSDTGADDGRTQTTTTQMTTRYKRAASNAAASLAANTATSSGVDAKKRRHTLMHDAIRKAIKKKEASAKQNAATQRKPAAIHDTHGQYNKLPRYTPAELSRIKHEKETLVREQTQQRQQVGVTRMFMRSAARS